MHADRAESHSCEHWPQVQPVSTTSRIVQYRQQLLQQPVLKWIVTTFQCSKTAYTEYRYLISFAHHICPCCKKKVKMQRYENLSTPVTLLCFSGRSWWLVSVHKQGTCIGVYTNLGANSMGFHLQSYLLLFASRVKSDETSHTRLFPNSSLIVFVFYSQCPFPFDVKSVYRPSVCKLETCQIIHLLFGKGMLCLIK